MTDCFARGGWTGWGFPFGPVVRTLFPMRALIPLLCLGVLVAAFPRVAAKPPALPAAAHWPELADALRHAIDSSHAPGASWGVVVANADSGKVWFATNQTHLLVPASNTKLFSVALALAHFGPDHRFATDLAIPGATDAAGTTAGPLWIRGGGVPFLAGTTDPRRSLAPLAASLSARHVRRITGGAVLDASWIEAAPHGSGWNWDDLQEAYAPPVGPFVWNGNAAHVLIRGGTAPGQPAIARLGPIPGLIDVDVRAVTVATNQPTRLSFRRRPGETRLRIDGSIRANGSHTEHVSVPDGTHAFGLALRTALEAEGIRLDGPVRVAAPGENVPAPWEPIPGPALSAIAADCLKPSDNLLAQLLLLQVGADARRHASAADPDAGDDEARGIAALAGFLKTMGISGNEASFEEGSGLSRKNVVSPAATVRLLRHARRQPWGKTYLDALPVGGIDGTLASRFSAGPARGNVRAKTGSLRHVQSLAGYVATAGGQPLVFAVCVNGFQSEAAGASARAEIDRLVEALAAFPGRGPE